MPYAAGLALAVTLAGCAAESAAPMPAGTIPSPSSATSSVPTSTPSSSPTTKSSAAPDFPEGVPAAARKHTKEGAVAFVEHFITQVNRAWTGPDASRLDHLCLPTSKACTAFRDDAKELEAKGRRYDGQPATILSTAPMGVIEGSHRVFVHLVQEERDIVDSSGRTIKTDSREELRLLALVKWGKRGWQLVSLGSVS